MQKNYRLKKRIESFYFEYEKNIFYFERTSGSSLKEKDFNSILEMKEVLNFVPTDNSMQLCKITNCSISVFEVYHRFNNERNHRIIAKTTYLYEKM